jgi:hypothetical protein
VARCCDWERRLIYNECARDGIWAAEDENTPEADNKTDVYRKSPFTIFWNPHGFDVARMLLPALHFMHHGESMKI